MSDLSPIKRFGFSFFLLICTVLFFNEAFAQNPSQEPLPTISRPVVIDFEAVSPEVGQGQRSAVVITFKVPKYIWLGAKPEEARTPPGTKIQFKDNPYITFEEPVYPEPSVEGVPVKVGVTRVYKGEVKVVVPFIVKDGAPLGEQQITTLLTYTPGFNAGKLGTKVRDPHTTTIRVTGNNQSFINIPDPSVAEVPVSFQVQPEPWTFPPILSPMLREYKEGTFLTNALHTIFIDPPNHGKTIRQAFYPFASSSLQEGNGIGAGMALLNATKEGVMTGALSAFVYSNEFLGATAGVELLTCPAAYHNLQFSAEVADDYYSAKAIYENFTLGENDTYGIQTDIDISSDPRFLFYGIGAAADEEQARVYDHQNTGGTFDLYYFPRQKLRIGLGLKFRDVDVGTGLDDISGSDFDIGGEIPQLTDFDFANPELNTGSTVLGGRFNLIYDGRNQEFNPTKGFYGKFTTELNSITDDHGADLTDNYTKFFVDLRKYFSNPSQKYTILFRNEWTFTTENEIPFYEFPTLGGLKSIRAFDINRFRDQHSFFASAEIRYNVADIKVMGFPMTMVVGGFLDAGQVFNEDQGLDFGDDFNWAPGMSIRMVNYPNVGYTINIASAQDGVYFSGGISLPF